MEFKGRNLLLLYAFWVVYWYLIGAGIPTVITQRLDWETISSGYYFVTYIVWKINLQTSAALHAWEILKDNFVFQICGYF